MDGAPVEIDRLQEMSSTTTLNRTKIREIGRDGIVDWKKSIPTVSLTLRQYEYGTLEFWRQLTNKGASVDTITFADFKTPQVDVAGYKTDDGGTFLGTVLYKGLRTSGFSVNFADPDAIIERSFTLVGEDEMLFLNANKYLIYKRNVIAAGLNQSVTLSDPTPVADPDNSGQYLLRVTRSRAGVTTELTAGTEWSCTGATLTINGTSSADDVIRAWYTAGAYITGVEPFVNNDVDVGGISTDSVSIYLQSSNYLYRLQSANIDVSFDRQDIKEIGNKDVVSRGIRETTTKVTLGRILEQYTIEEILRGVAGLSYGKIDVREFSDGLNLIVKIYSDNDKTTFKIGYKLMNLAPVGDDAGNTVNDYITRGVTLEGDQGLITNVANLL